MSLFHFCKRSHCVDELRRRGWGPGLPHSVCLETLLCLRYVRKTQVHTNMQLEKTGYFHSFLNNSRESSLQLYQLQSFNDYSCRVIGNYSHHFSFLVTLRFTGPFSASIRSVKQCISILHHVSVIHVTLISWIT